MSHDSPPRYPPLPAAALTSAEPRILWIELSSKCPFDCIFCSRKTLRGSGEFMDMGMYRALIASLREPEIIRLNYSGESVHHPDLIEAISLAASTGAFVELVSAFSSLPLHRLEPLVRSGLSRLTVSIHTLGERDYEDIYRYGSLEDLKVRLRAFRRCQDELGVETPALDFAFVAMERNLGELKNLAAFARTLGVGDVFVHPLIRRDEIPISFPAELDGNRLRSTFLEKLRREIERVRSAFPDVRFPVSTREIETERAIGGNPGYYAGPLPAHARIHSCDQSPWDSVHILANGDIVTCEVRDRTPMGSLRTGTLAEIWHGEAYRAFRREYQSGGDAHCGNCAYKLAYVPGPISDTVGAERSHAKELVSGWHEGEDGIVWSKRRSRVILASSGNGSAGTAGRSLEISGLLPPGPNGRNRLEIFAAGALAGAVENATPALQPFSTTLPIDGGLPAEILFDLATRFSFRAGSQGGADVRELGFALQTMRLGRRRPPGKPRAAVRDLLTRAGRALPSARLLPLLLAWRMAGILCPVAGRRRRGFEAAGHWRKGISVLIPESATPEHLERSLASIMRAAAELDEPTEIVVSLNGAPWSRYEKIGARFPAVRWLHSDKALGFGGAIERGLKAVRFDWVYLLNSDMVPDPAALREVACRRGDRVFAIGSQIFFADPSVRREETGLTGVRCAGGLAEIFDIVPMNDTPVRRHLYAGGGSSLFRTKLLRRYCSDSRAYNPMYFEDAEWGARAWRDGFETLFAQDSKVWHAHRATVNILYTAEEVDRIFRRNQLQFSLRNGFFRGGAKQLEAFLTDRLDSHSAAEMAAAGRAFSLFRILLKNAMASGRELDLNAIGEDHSAPPPDAAGNRAERLFQIHTGVDPEAAAPPS